MRIHDSATRIESIFIRTRGFVRANASVIGRQINQPRIDLGSTDCEVVQILVLHGQ